jgi:hypothetical protein
LLRRAFTAAEPAADPGPPKDPATPDTATTGSGVVQWGIAMLEWAAVCKQRVDDWEQWYAGIAR